MKEQPKILLLAGEGESTAILYNYLIQKYPPQVIIEESVPKKKFFSRRINKLGYRTVIGQLFFLAGIVPFLKFFYKNRIKKICGKYNLNNTPIPEDKIQRVISVNSNNCINYIKKHNPDLIIINGTRIISKKVLRASATPFINLHAGITPKYRGVHGGYWSVVNKEPHLFGTTLHFVNEGIDTGKIIGQKTILPKKIDNYITYPYIQQGLGLQLLDDFLEAVIDKSVEEQEPLTTESHLWSHPTFFQYLFSKK